MIWCDYFLSFNYPIGACFFCHTKTFQFVPFSVESYHLKFIYCLNLGIICLYFLHCILWMLFVLICVFSPTLNLIVCKVRDMGPTLVLYLWLVIFPVPFVEKAFSVIADQHLSMIYFHSTIVLLFFLFEWSLKTTDLVDTWHNKNLSVTEWYGEAFLGKISIWVLLDR